jgi:hypothetical protein
MPAGRAHPAVAGRLKPLLGAEEGAGEDIVLELEVERVAGRLVDIGTDDSRLARIRTPRSISGKRMNCVL